MVPHRCMFIHWWVFLDGKKYIRLHNHCKNCGDICPEFGFSGPRLTQEIGRCWTMHLQPASCLHFKIEVPIQTGKSLDFVSCGHLKITGMVETEGAKPCLSIRLKHCYFPPLGQGCILGAPWGSKRRGHHPIIGDAKAPHRPLGWNSSWKEIVHACWRGPKAGHVWKKKQDNWPKLNKDLEGLSCINYFS